MLVGAEDGHNVYTLSSDLPRLLESPQLVPLFRPAKPFAKDPAFEAYLVNCSDYLRRQIIIYEHWPQRRYDARGYKNEKVFADMNA